LTEVISVKFNCHGKAYYFDPNGVGAKAGDAVIVETSKGLDIGECSVGPHYVVDESIITPLRPVIRIATEDDNKIAALNKTREKEAFDICKKKIAEHGLEMKLVDVECGFEGNKILFFFTADGRVDFRDLVKDLASVFRTRIELRQIGVRDETKMLGGLGICGKPYCCSQFLNDFQPVSTKMAKTQSMSLNPTKISGSCGRLMCCLRYEQDAYEDLLKTIPKVGAFVQTPKGYGSVAQTNVLRQKVKVRIDNENDEEDFKVFDAAEIAQVPGGRPRQGEPLPHVLECVKKAVEVPEPEEPEEDPWAAPSLFAEETAGDQGKINSAAEKSFSDKGSDSNEQKKDQPDRQRAQNAGGRERSQPVQVKKQGTNLQGAQTPGKSLQTAQNPRRDPGAQENQPKNKPSNQNRNKKHYYGKPKPRGGGQNPAS